ncbi:heme exporter protein CcmD [Paucibacter sp. TC2R-5]|uniref:heme exporter protein CcmD n=1 Tax=Paucibacter sp. TC2R-5 TaxID=2893555 RepID=UPI0021E450E0|nr:heme exporter protein CcmD [Paucibacter sp. TC2R-5]MCV2361282.1 heme exporter protein CcmD [Paucibacter sp. TC2R-5]
MIAGVWDSVLAAAWLGGYGRYVWGSFGVVAAALGLELLSLRRQRQGILRQLHAQLDDL